MQIGFQSGSSGIFQNFDRHRYRPPGRDGRRVLRPNLILQSFGKVKNFTWGYIYERTAKNFVLAGCTRSCHGPPGADCQCAGSQTRGRKVAQGDVRTIARAEADSS